MLSFSQRFFFVVLLTLSAVVDSFTATTTTTPAPSIPLTDEQVRQIQLQNEDLARARHDKDSWDALFVSVKERPTPVQYTIPEKLSSPLATAATKQQLASNFPPGCFLRVGPNGAPPTEGFLDGDGLVHCVTFPPDLNKQQTGTFSATYIETEGRKRENAATSAGKKYKGTLGDVPRGWPLLQAMVENAVNFRTLQAQKDTCNTNICVSANRILALMEQCPPAEIQVTTSGRVETVGSNCLLDGAIKVMPITGGSLSAHGRTCPETGDRVHVSYNSDSRPFVRVDRFAPGFNLKHSIPVDIPTPVMVHDSVMTRNYAVVFDFPLTIRPMRMLFDSFPVDYEPDNGARIGLVPLADAKDANAEPIWFDCKPGVVLHAANAFEDGTTVTVHALQSFPDTSKSYLEQFTVSYLYEWVLDVKTGQVIHEKCLNPQEMVEFPTINPRYNCQEADSLYCLMAHSMGGPSEVYALPKQGIVFNGVVKLALTDDGQRKKGDVLGRYQLPKQWTAASEPTLVPKTNGGDGEYILMLASYVPAGMNWKDVMEDSSRLKSQVLVLDGDRLDDGPIWLAELPDHIPHGLHSCFVEWDKMK